MRKLFISAAIVAGLILGGGLSSFAAGDTKAGQSEMKGAQDMPQISGKIIAIKGDSFKLKDQMGKTHKIKPAEPSELAKLNVGDNVTVQLDKEGKATAINKTETMQGGSQNQENQKQENQRQGSQ